MIPPWLLLVLILGVNFTVWAAIGLLRFTDSSLNHLRGKTANAATRRARRPTLAAPLHPGTGQGACTTAFSRGHGRRPRTMPRPATHWQVPRYQPDTGTDNGEFVSIDEAARQLGVMPSAVYRWINDGFIAAPQTPLNAPWQIQLTDDLRARLVRDPQDVSRSMLEPIIASSVALTAPHHPEPIKDATAKASSRRACRRPLAIADVAVLMAAHNEEVVIGDSLRAIISLVPVENVHVVSDFSSDRTVEVARQYGANVIETATNVGKAGALAEGIRRFGLTDRFGAVLLLDADTRLDPGYFTAALPLFDDPSISAVAGCAHSHWRTTGISPMGRLLIAHRSRVYALTQRLLKYGQTWGPTNATHIVPGFASLYRTDVLTEITINPPGLVIEDFNMTFEVYQKKLGRIAFSLKAIAVTQDPDNLHDYIRQTKRWTLGLWQTVRRHRLRPGLFSAMLSLLLLELLSASLLFVLLPALVVVLAVPEIIPATLHWSWVSSVHSGVAAHLSLDTIVIGVLVPDYLLTCAVAAVERQPRYLGYGLLFAFVRTIDAAIALYTLPRAWLEKSSGRWVSPTRRDPAGTANPSTR